MAVQKLSAQLEKRLKDEQVIWLTTVRADGTPQPTPVWFLWEDGTFLIYTIPGTKKLANIEHNPHAALNLNSDEVGDQVAVFTGEAQVDRGTPAADQNPAYLAKYGEGIKSIDMTPASFAQAYSVPVRFTPRYIRG